MSGARRRDGDDDERRLFEEAMRGVRPLRPGAERVAGRPETRPPKAAAPTEAPALVVEEAGEQVSGRAAGISRERLRQLRGARPEATLDLHGLAAAQARRRLEAFLAEARVAGRRCVLVVPGRGLRSGPDGPVLRGLVVEALARGPRSAEVLGFTSAPPALGGTGALLVLLRR